MVFERLCQPIHLTRQTEWGSSVSPRTRNLSQVLLLISIPQVTLSVNGVAPYWAARGNTTRIHGTHDRNLQTS